jgi:hypothetical protein
MEIQLHVLCIEISDLVCNDEPLLVQYTHGRLLASFPEPPGRVYCNNGLLRVFSTLLLCFVFKLEELMK